MRRLAFVAMMAAVVAFVGLATAAEKPAVGDEFELAHERLNSLSREPSRER